MIINSLPVLDPHSAASDHSFVFDAHNYDLKQLITRYRGTAVEHTASGYTVTGWQKSIYHFGGLNREVPILVSIFLVVVRMSRRFMAMISQRVLMMLTM